MSTNKVPFKVYLSQETINALAQRHPSYGEAGRVVKELIEAYVLRTKPIRQAPAPVDQAAQATASRFGREEDSMPMPQPMPSFEPATPEPYSAPDTPSFDPGGGDFGGGGSTDSF